LEKNGGKNHKGGFFMIKSKIFIIVMIIGLLLASGSVLISCDGKCVNNGDCKGSQNSCSDSKCDSNRGGTSCSCAW